MNHRRSATELPRVSACLDELMSRYREMTFEERLALHEVLTNIVELDPTPMPRGNVVYLRGAQ